MTVQFEKRITNFRFIPIYPDIPICESGERIRVTQNYDFVNNPYEIDEDILQLLRNILSVTESGVSVMTVSIRKGKEVIVDVSEDPIIFESFCEMVVKFIEDFLVEKIRS